MKIRRFNEMGLSLPSLNREEFIKWLNLNKKSKIYETPKKI